MNFVPGDFLSVCVFWSILVFVVFSITAGVYVAYLRVTASRPTARTFSGSTFAMCLIGMKVAAIMVESGYLESRPVPYAVLYFGLSMSVAVGFALSSVGRTFAFYLSSASLIAFQAFRLPLEWVLHQWAAQGTVPETMTWTGSNWDIVTGGLALVCAPLAWKLKGPAQQFVVWSFNLTGFILLLNVMRVAILSSPFPFGWGTVPPLQLAFHLPYAWIVPVCVGGALAGHIILFRRLFGR